jgi:hypothetical protein
MDDDHYNNDDQSRYSPFDLRNPLYTVYLGDQGYQTSTDRNPTGVFTYGQRRHLKVCAPDNDLTDIMRT